ncbi:hypothetical protein TNCV_2028211 [Trichonephila clavipes]|nr:hypothetical protein TNCV_2028211 [Trichonephila clavipes]
MEQAVQHVFLHFLVGRCRLIGLNDRVQPLGVKYQKRTNFHSNNCRSETEMSVSFTQWLLKPSCHLKCTVADNECNLVTCDLSGTSRHVV